MIDYQWAQILATTAKTDLRGVMAMHSALTSTAAQRAIFTALAKIRLTSEEHTTLELVQKATSPLRNLRNDFCHHLWGTADDVKGALLLIDPTAHVDLYVSYLEEKNGTKNYHELDRSRMMIWTKEDLEAAATEARWALMLVIDLHAYLGGPSPNKNGTAEQKKSALSNSPLVARVLRPQSPKKQKSLRQKQPPRTPPPE